MKNRPLFEQTHTLTQLRQTPTEASTQHTDKEQNKVK